MTIELDHEAFRTAIGDVQRVAAALHDEREAIGCQVEALLQGWTGVAGAAFSEGWAQWQSGATDVLDGLLGMSRLLDAVHDDLTHRDIESQASLDRLASRILARLG
jgi:WXG100 family type VII secretion target